MSTATLTSTRETIASVYDAFAKGNIPFILDSVSDDFTWQDPCDASIVPYGGIHSGRDGFLSFFQNLGGSINTTTWEVDSYVSEGNKVVATGRHGFEVKKTGKKVMSYWAMVWTFRNDVPVAGRAYYNTSATEDAFRG